MSSSGMSVGGLASGIDTTAIIDGLVGIEKQKVTRLEIKQDNASLTLTAWGTLQSNLTSLQSKGESLSKAANFDKYTLTTSNEDIVSLVGGDGGLPGAYEIGVYQTAKYEKAITNTYASATNALAYTGSFKINVSNDYKKENPAADPITITVDATDSLKDIVNKINAQPNAGATASILKLGTNQYGMVLTSKDTGAAGITYTEETGTVLRDLGILDASGSKGNLAQKVQGAALTAGGLDITAATTFAAIDGAGILAGDSITINGTDRNGNRLAEKTFVISDPATETVADFLSAIEDAYNGMVTATVENGKITVTDKSSGTSALKVELTANNEGGGSFNPGALFTIAQAGKNGMLQVGQDAFFSIDGLNMSSAANEAEDVIQGVTIKMKKADVSESVQTSVERDFTAIKTNVQEMLDAINLVFKTIKEKSAVKVTEKSDSASGKDSVSKGPLAGDSTVNRVRSEIVNIMSRTHDELKGETYQTFASIGIISDRLTGEYKIDEEKFKKALNTNYENVKQLFTLSGTGADSNYIYGTSGSKTQSGRYSVDVDGKTVSLLNPDDSVKATYSASVDGNVLSVSEKGYAEGLAITVPATGSSVFTFSKGLGREIADYIKLTTNAYEGFITLRTKNIQQQIDDYDDKIAAENTRIERYQETLTKQYAAMEQVMARLQSQSGQMQAQLR
ncbi:MAG: flagellar filament capping protein FliD [Fibrobacteres bacterium]|nr:flagellar filament capping protein FliD [Fibrobacterota bacterium]